MLNDLTCLNDRAILTLSGPDRKNFLQGLITNDMGKLSSAAVIYAALLTPQGKYLHDFFICEKNETLYLDGERSRIADLFRRLMMYKLRADVSLVDASEDYTVMASPEPLVEGLVSYADPRHSHLGYRTIMAARPANQQSGQQPDQQINAYDDLRLSLGLPAGSRDFDVDKTLILEGNMAELGAVDFNKGCYVGQEVTARMKYRATLKKRLLPIDVDGPLPARGTIITNEGGKKIGDLRSGQGGRAMGYFRLADMEFDQKYHCGEAQVSPWKPDWYPKSE